MRIDCWFLACLFAWPLGEGPGQDPKEEIQQTQTESPEENEPLLHLEDVVVTATRSRRICFDVPAFVNIVSENDFIETRLSPTVPQAFKETPGVMVQKTSHGQGSPFIRGFTGFRTLFLIDGIRLNNAVFRDGPNQYWNTVDLMSVSRLEMVKGPSSVLYGSDAVGGTVNAFTRSREAYGDGFLWDRRLFYRYSSAEDSNMGRAEISGSLDDDLGFLLGGTVKEFGEIRAGRGVGLQRKTDYDEWDGDLKVEYFLNSDAKLVFAHQRVKQDDPWRAHKTLYGESWEGTTVGDERMRKLDQSRALTYLQYHRNGPTSFMERLMISFSYQVQEEDRHRIKNDGRQDDQGFHVGTFGAMIQMESESRGGLWTYGVEYYRDNVNSYSKKLNGDGSFAGYGIQGPVADDSHYDLLGVYIQDEISLWERLDLILGARYTFAAADADRFEDPVSGLEDSLSENWSTVVGSARLLYRLDEAGRWNLFTGVSQGFRAPNLSDLTRLDTARTDEIETPSPDLDPEQYISYELGIKTLQDRWEGQASYFYTDIRDMIVRTPTGNTIDGDVEVTKKNGGDGYVHGIELGTRCRFYPSLTAFTSFAWIYGAVEGYPTSSTQQKEDTLDRLMPPMGNVGVHFEEEAGPFWIEGVCDFAFQADKLSERDKADTQRIPPGGTPGYAVFHLRSGWNLRKNLILTMALENITNKDYRIHGSGQNEPGRGILLGVDFRF